MRKPLWAAFVAGLWLGVAAAEAREQLREAAQRDRERRRLEATVIAEAEAAAAGAEQRSQP